MPGTVAFCATLVLLVETVLFHIATFIHDYFVATSVIAYAVLGIGLGALAASRVLLATPRLFEVICLGTTLSLYATAGVLVGYPAPWALGMATAVTVAFPVTYVIVVFRDRPGGRVYLWDMAGAALGVVATAVLYALLSSESILALLLWVIPLIGLLMRTRAEQLTGGARRAARRVTAPFVAIGLVLFTLQVAFDTFNLYKVFRRDAPGKGKIFRRFPPEIHRATYDSLVGRIDILEVKRRSYWVSYDGEPNDVFTPREFPSYEQVRAKGEQWPLGDERVPYGPVEAPRFFIVGSAARGIIPTVKQLSPVEQIVPVEIQPGIVKAMTRDFVEHSGYAYRGLDTVVGNAISLLKSTDEKFDVITLINTHSGKNIGTHSGPDYLHVAEHYNLYFDHLTDRGYLLFEERPFRPSGILGIYRLINTVWQVLAERGARDPSQHFLVWEWNSRRDRHEVQYDYLKKRDVFREAGRLFTGIVVTREPLVGELRERLLAWFHEAARPSRLAYLKGYLELDAYADVFGMIETGDFSALEDQGFDSKPVTLNRPFLTFSTTDTSRLHPILKTAGLLSVLLSLVLGAMLLRRASPGRAVVLGAYQILVGLAYFLIEIALVNAYGNVFVSAAWALVLVLGLLLVASGLGGVIASRLPTWLATTLLVPTALLALFVPELLLWSGVPVFVGKLVGVLAILASGLLMGVFFPRGLVLADQWSLANRIPHLFALNSVAGSFAVVLALYCGVAVGYRVTILAAIFLYALAGLLCTVAAGFARSAG